MHLRVASADPEVVQVEQAVAAQTAAPKVFAAVVAASATIEVEFDFQAFVYEGSIDQALRIALGLAVGSDP